jgi:hypothetical protein
MGRATAWRSRMYRGAALRELSLLALHCSKQAKRDNSFFLSDHPMPSKQTTGRR